MKSIALDDFGEIIPEARKHIRTAAWRDSMDRGIRVETPKFSDLWPQPKWDDLLQDGIPSRQVALHRALRDLAQSRRRRQGGDLWLKAMLDLKSVALRVLDGSPRELRRIEERRHDAEAGRGAEAAMSRMFLHLNRIADLYERLGHDVSLQKIEVANLSRDGAGQEKDPMIVIRSYRNGWRRRHAKGADWAEAKDDFIRQGYADYIKEHAPRRRSGLPTKTPAEKDLRLYQWTGGNVEKPWRIGIVLSQKETVDLAAFDSLDEARKCLRENGDELLQLWERMQQVPRHRSPCEGRRIGPQWAHGDITDTEFSRALMPRGIQFGASMPQGERRSQLRRAYHAMRDLGWILGIEKERMFLDGHLALAFGARGRGGINAACAHFESNHSVINLTRRAGAGSLAHEWWHALDAHIAQQEALNRNKDMDGRMPKPEYEFASDSPHQPTTQLDQAVRALMDWATNSNFRERSHRLCLAQGRSGLRKGYWTRPHELTARMFEAYLDQTMQRTGLANDYLCSILPEQSWTHHWTNALEDEPSTYPYPTAEEVREYAPLMDAVLELSMNASPGLTPEAAQADIRRWAGEDEPPYEPPAIDDEDPEQEPLFGM